MPNGTATTTAINVTFIVPAINGSIPNNGSFPENGNHCVPKKEIRNRNTFKEFKRFKNKGENNAKRCQYRNKGCRK